jgi:hypothetical protein
MDDHKEPDGPSAKEVKAPTKLPDLEKGDDDLHNTEIHEDETPAKE